MQLFCWNNCIRDIKRLESIPAPLTIQICGPSSRSSQHLRAPHKDQRTICICSNVIASPEPGMSQTVSVLVRKTPCQYGSDRISAPPVILQLIAILLSEHTERTLIQAKKKKTHHGSMEINIAPRAHREHTSSPQKRIRSTLLESFVCASFHIVSSS